MKPSRAGRIAWGTCVLTLALIAGILVLSVLNSADFSNVSFSIVGVASVVVGAVVASRRPANLVGWLFLGGALISTLQGLATEYAVYGIVTNPGALPLSEAAAWFSNAIEFFGRTGFAPKVALSEEFWFKFVL